MIKSIEIVIPVGQKSNHCLVACLSSFLMDDKGLKLQEFIVNSFPEELQKGSGANEGIPIDGDIIEKLIVQVGISKYARHISRENKDMIEDLKNGRFPLNKILLRTNSGELHCWRIDAVEENGLRVMEPMDGDFRKMTWDEFNSSDKGFILLSDEPINV